jgi:hypothetical protein
MDRQNIAQRRAVCVLIPCRRCRQRHPPPRGGTASAGRRTTAEPRTAPLRQRGAARGDAVMRRERAVLVALATWRRPVGRVERLVADPRGPRTSGRAGRCPRSAPAPEPVLRRRMPYYWTEALDPRLACPLKPTTFVSRCCEPLAWGAHPVSGVTRPLCCRPEARPRFGQRRRYRPNQSRARRS